MSKNGQSKRRGKMPAIPSYLKSKYKEDWTKKLEQELHADWENKHPSAKKKKKGKKTSQNNFKDK